MPEFERTAVVWVCCHGNGGYLMIAEPDVLAHQDKESGNKEREAVQDAGGGGGRAQVRHTCSFLPSLTCTPPAVYVNEGWKRSQFEGRRWANCWFVASVTFRLLANANPVSSNTLTRRGHVRASGALPGSAAAPPSVGASAVNLHGNATVRWRVMKATCRRKVAELRGGERQPKLRRTR